MSSSRTQGLRGLTLVELLVVLVILILLAGLAIQSTEQVLQQGRFDATQRQLEHIDRAVFDRSDNGFGSESISGYLADIGALPTGLEDLITQPAGITAYTTAFTGSQGDSLSIGRGWRGPYLKAPPGVTNIGDDFFGGAVTYNPGARTVVSAGANGIPGDADDLSLNLAANGSVTVTVNPNDESGTPLGAGFTADLRLYEPDGNGGVTERLQAGQEPGTPFTYTDISPGVRLIRAYDSTNPTTRMSRVASVVVRPNGTVNVTLVFPAP